MLVAVTPGTVLAVSCAVPLPQDALDAIAADLRAVLGHCADPVAEAVVLRPTGVRVFRRGAGRDEALAIVLAPGTDPVSVLAAASDLPGFA